MMTKLEEAAKAVYDEQCRWHVEHGVDPANLAPWEAKDRPLEMRFMAAALRALRDPSPAMLDRKKHAFDMSPGTMTDVWKFMIDALLAEEPK